MALTRILKPIIPPLLWNIGKNLKRRLFRSVDHFAYATEGWSTRLPESATSHDYWRSSVARERSACEALIARVQAHEPSLTADADVKHALFGYVLARAGRNQDRLTVLDYGGNLGDYYWLATAFMPAVDLEYHCKELPPVAAAGRALSPAVIWHTDDGCLATVYDLVMFSSSLQYLENWRDVLTRAARSVRGYLFLSDVPTVRNVPSYVVTQRSGGMTTLQYQLNHREIVETVQAAGLNLIHEFNLGAHPPVEKAPEQPVCVGLLFQPISNTGSTR